MADADESGPQTSRSRWPAITGGAAALLTAAGSVVGALAAAGVIGGGNGSSNGTQQTIGTVRTSSTVTLPFEATPEEARLAELIPPVIVPDCRRGKELSSAMLATVSCSPPDASVTYSLFESPGTLSTYMNARVGLGDSERKCGQAPSGSSTYNAEGETVGRLVCYVRQSHAWIEWSNVRAVVYAYGYRADGDWKALFNFWN